MVPRQPVEHLFVPARRRGRSGRSLRGIGGERVERLLDHLGQAGRAARSSCRSRSPPDRPPRPPRRPPPSARSRSRRHSATASPPNTAGSAAMIIGSPLPISCQRLGVRRLGINEDRRGLHLGEDVPQPRMIAARDAVSRADRAQDPARRKCGEGHRRDRDAVLGHDHQHAAAAAGGRSSTAPRRARRRARSRKLVAFHAPPASRSASAGASPFFSAIAKKARARLPSIGSIRMIGA